MAKIQFGAIVTDIRGKLNGQVFKKTNSGHAITRKGAPPRNTLTKSNVRFQRVLQISRSYRYLSITDKNNLKAFAIAHPTKDVFGNDIILSPRAMFQKLCCNLSVDTILQPDYSTLSSAINTITIGNVGYELSERRLLLNISDYTSRVLVKIWIAPSAFEALSAEVNKRVLFGVLNVTSGGLQRFDLSSAQTDYLANTNILFWAGIQLMNDSGYTSAFTWYKIDNV